MFFSLVVARLSSALLCLGADNRSSFTAFLVSRRRSGKIQGRKITSDYQRPRINAILDAGYRRSWKPPRLGSLLPV